jgi:hypothetical protein
LGSLGATINAGFASLAAAVASEVRLFPESWKELSDANVVKDLVATVKSTEVKKLLSEGRIEKAIAALDDVYVKDQTKVEEELAVLLLSKEEKDWLKALNILTERKIEEPKYFLTLAYRFWSASRIERAIEIGETGLALAAEKDPTLTSKFKNSLAYYYADGGAPQHEKLAREYAAEARQERPDNAGTLDTEGYVEITYGKTPEEVLRGVSICDEARKRGVPFAAYAKHIAKANRRLETL